MEKNQWNLKTLEIELMTYGEFSGKYVGKIKFENGNRDAFTFALSPEETAEYISVVSRRVVLSAEGLGKQLAESLTLLPDSFTSNKQIQLQAQ